MLESFANFLQNTGLYALISSGGIDAVKTIIMIAIACVLLYLAIVKNSSRYCYFRLRSVCFVKLTDD